MQRRGLPASGRQPVTPLKAVSGTLRERYAANRVPRPGAATSPASARRSLDEQKTRTLVGAAWDARHIVLISVVGADRVPQGSAIDRAFFGYFGMKLATERVVEHSVNFRDPP